MNSSTPAFISNPVSLPIPAPQPGGAAPIEGLNANFTGTAVEINGELWAVQTVLDTSTNTDAIAWYEINVSTKAITNQGVISDSSLFFYDPSISVNSSGNIAIGFSGSDSTEAISSYAVYGTIGSSGVSVTPPTLLKQGTGIYTQNSTITGTPATLSSTSASPFNTTGTTTFTTAGSGNSATVTVKLATPAGSGGAIVALGFSGTALANYDYSIGPDTNVNDPSTEVTNLVGPDRN